MRVPVVHVRVRRERTAKLLWLWLFLLLLALALLLYVRLLHHIDHVRSGRLGGRSSVRRRSAGASRYDTVLIRVFVFAGMRWPTRVRRVR